VISGFRDRLIAEHLGVAPSIFQERLKETSSLHEAIAALQREGRTLRELDETKEWPEALVSIASVADPEEPIALDFLSTDRVSASNREKGKPAWGRLAFFAVLIGAMAALWRYTPLAELAGAENVIGWAKAIGATWWAPILVMVSYTPACFVMFPRPLITLASVIAFGPWLGFLYSLIGIVAAAVVTFFAGRRMRRDTVRRLAGPKIERMVDVLRRHGLLAMSLLRLVPIAPFFVVGIVAGAVRLKLWHLAAGTAIGMLPGTLAATIFGDQLEHALAGGRINWWLVGGCAAVLGGAAYLVKRWFAKMARRMDSEPKATK
jgi:phospholipase D1/2